MLDVHGNSENGENGNALNTKQIGKNNIIDLTWKQIQDAFSFDRFFLSRNKFTSKDHFFLKSRDFCGKCRYSLLVELTQTSSLSHNSINTHSTEHVLADFPETQCKKKFPFLEG